MVPCTVKTCVLLLIHSILYEHTALNPNRLWARLDTLAMPRRKVGMAMLAAYVPAAVVDGSFSEEGDTTVPVNVKGRSLGIPQPGT